MKVTKIAAIALAGLLFWAGASTPASADVSFDFFYSNLGSHGSWLASSSYGQVWQPSVYTRDWNPYYDGHWVYTDCGWTWVSDYDWGAVPYHYGTWVMDSRYGWVWVPGYVWGPSWVVFREGPDYMGWAPVPPDFSVGGSFGSINIDASFFVFVPTRSFTAERVRTYMVPRTQITTIINRTTIVKNNITIVNNVVVNNGPNIREIERVSGHKVERVPIERVRNVSPTGSGSRDEIRVNPERMKKGLRVSEPMKTAPANARGREKRGGGGEVGGGAPAAGQALERPESGSGRAKGQTPGARRPQDRPGAAAAPPAGTNEPGGTPPAVEREKGGRKQRPEPPGMEPPNRRVPNPRARPRQPEPNEPPVASDPSTRGGREPRVGGESTGTPPPSARGQKAPERDSSAKGKSRPKAPPKGKPEEKKEEKKKPEEKGGGGR